MRAPTPADAANRARVLVSREGMQPVVGTLIYVQGSPDAVPRRATSRRSGQVRRGSAGKRVKTKVRLSTGNVISVRPEVVQVLDDEEVV